MAHRVGALLLPAPAPPFAPPQPDQPNAAALDPALDVLGAFFQAMLEHYAGQAWKSIAPNEPVVRKLFVGYDPEELDFQIEDTPVLALWRENDGAPTRLSEGNAQSQSLVNVLYVLPPADEQKLAARSPFLNVFKNIMLLAYKQERDPCWIRPGDEASDAARTYGSYVWGHAGIDGWGYTGTKRVPVVVPTGSGEPQTYPGYLATWTILESSESDPSAFGSTINGVRVGTGITSVGFNLTDRTPTEEDPDVFIRQTGRVPKT